MSAFFKYGTRVSVIPADAARKIDRATKKDIKILILLGANPEVLRLCENDVAAASRELDCTEADLISSLAFWRGAGILSENDSAVSEEAIFAEKPEEKKIELPVAQKTKLERADELPKYTTEELATLLEQRKDAAQLVDECQKILGKIFNTHEVNIVLGLGDYLGLDGSYILTLCDYCVSIGKKSLRYIEKKAFGLYDEGITTAEALIAHIEKLNKLFSFEGQIRKLYGMKDRELTTREKKFIEKWVMTFGYGMDVIKKAYEKNADATTDPTPAYTNAILERWNKEGLKTLAEIESAENQKLPGEGSFDTDDFFEAALKRSMAEMQANMQKD